MDKIARHLYVLNNIRQINMIENNMTEITIYKGYQIFQKGMIYCAPDLMFASASLKGLKLTIKRMLTRKFHPHKISSK